MHNGHDVTLPSDFPGPGARTWRPLRLLVLIGASAAALAVIWAIVAGEPLDRLVAVFVAVVLAAVTVVGTRRRLVAGPRGLLVHGTSSARILPWSQIRSIRSARSAHLGICNRTMEIDTVDDDLLVFSRIDLGADPADVFAVVIAWWRA